MIAEALAVDLSPFARDPADAGRADRRISNAVIAVLGNGIEYFDFTIYGFLALTLSRVFFAISDPTLALLASFATFGVGSGARPVGALIFGRLGDRLGRRFVLIASSLLMTLGSLAIGLAPGYATAGISGAIILVAGRMLQGVSAGGEFGSAISYLIEWAPARRRGLYGSFHQLGAGTGLLMGALATAVLNSLLSPGQVLAWGWRIPFLLGGALAFAAFLLRLRMTETPEFERIRQHRVPAQTAPVAVLIPILQNLGIGALWSVSVFASVIYMPTFMVQSGAIAPDSALWASVIALIAMLVAIPLAGSATDAFGSKPIILVSAIGFVLCAFPGYWLVSSGVSYSVKAGVVVLFGILTGIISGAGPVAIGELYQASVRSTWTSIASALQSATFGGFAPAIATLLIRMTGVKTAPGFYVMFAAALTGLTALSLRSRRGALA